MAVVLNLRRSSTRSGAGWCQRRALSNFATGLDPLLAAVNEELDFVATGKGVAKWIRGEYGTGKTFAARYLCAKARQRRFATSEVQSPSTTHLWHHLETVYRRLIERLETAAMAPTHFRPLWRVGCTRSATR